MLDKFEKDKRYKFSKELFIEDSKQDGDSEKSIQTNLEFWANEIDNQFVNVTNEYIGNVGWYNVTPHWCEEVIDELGLEE